MATKLLYHAGLDTRSISRFFCLWNAVDLHGLLPKSALTANDVPIRVVTNRILYPLPHGYSNSFLMTDLI